MAGANVVEMNEANFDRELNAEVPVLVDFGAVWCGPCKALATIVEKVADEKAGTLKVGKIDIDDAPEVAARFGIRGVPTLLVFKGGKEVARHVGVTNREALLKLIGS